MPEGARGIARLSAGSCARDHGHMPSDDIIRRVRLLIGDVIQQAAPDVPSSKDVSRYIAFHLRMSEARAQELLRYVSLQDAESTRLMDNGPY